MTFSSFLVMSLSAAEPTTRYERRWARPSGSRGPSRDTKKRLRPCSSGRSCALGAFCSDLPWASPYRPRSRSSPPEHRPPSGVGALTSKEARPMAPRAHRDAGPSRPEHSSQRLSRRHRPARWRSPGFAACRGRPSRTAGRTHLRALMCWSYAPSRRPWSPACALAAPPAWRAPRKALPCGQRPCPSARR